MLAKLSALLSSKVAIAALGGALVLGGGATVAAAETGHLPPGVTIPGISHSQGDDSHSGDNQGDNNNGNHADVVAVQGTLTAYNATAHTITVTGKAEDSDENSNENDGDENDKGSGTPTAHGTPGTGDDHENGTPTAHGTPGTGDDHEGTPTAHATSTPGTTCSLKSPFTIALNSDTKINGQAKSESDLKGNIGHGVEVQANEGTSCNLTAAKVTVQGKDDSSGSDHQGKVFVGTVGTVGTNSFTLQPEQGSALTVNVSSTTKFEGVKDLTGLTHGMRVAAMGTQQSDGSVTATMVAAEGSDDHGGGQGQKTEIGGQVASVDTMHNSFAVTTEGNHSVTVHVTSATVYEGDVHGLADLKAGMGVAATGTQQADGSLQATHVAAQASGNNG